MPAPDARPCVRTAALAVVVVLLAHGPMLGGGFQSDDFPLVAATRQGGALAFWTRGEMFFRPLVPVSFWLDHRLYGLAAPGFHATNLALHAAVALCVGWIAMRLASPGRRAPTSLWLAGTALFAALPSHSEPVDWIAARTDLLAALGGALSIVLLLRAGGCERAGRRRALQAASLAAFVIGLLAKESIVLLPGLVALIELVHAGAPPGRAAARAAGYASLALAYVGVRAWMIGDWVGGYGAATHFDPDRIAWNLLYHPVRSVLPPLRSGAFLIAASGVALAAALAAVAMLRRGGVAAAWRLAALAAAFVLAAAPSLSLGVAPGSMEGERFLYWPSTVVCVTIVAAAARWLHAPRGRAVACALVLLCAAASFAGATTQAAAGRLAEHQAHVAAALPDEGRILMGPLLDQRGGAYVFRNGFEAAVRLYAPGGARAWMPVAPVRWHPRRPDDAPRLRFLAGGRSLEASAEGGGWLSVVEHVAPHVDVAVRSPERVVFGLKDAGPADLVVLFDGDGVWRCRPGVDCPGAADGRAHPADGTVD